MLAQSSEGTERSSHSRDTVQVNDCLFNILNQKKFVGFGKYPSHLRKNYKTEYRIK